VKPDFSISVGFSGSIKLVDTSNNMQIRIMGDLLPRASFKSEKMFRFLRFSRAKFHFRVIFDEASQSRSVFYCIQPAAIANLTFWFTAEHPVVVLGLTDQYYIPYAAFFTSQDIKFVSASDFQASWLRYDILTEISTIEIYRRNIS